MAGLLALCCGGCLVTDKIVFPVDPDIPPTILDEPGTQTPKIGAIFCIDKPATPEWSLTVKVRDQNPQQELWAHWRVVGDNDPTPPFEKDMVPLPAVGQLGRDFTFKVQSDTLQEGKCHHLQLAVSGSFFDHTDPRFDDPRYFDFPSNIDDLAEASWWVWEGKCDPATGDSARLLASCQAKLLTPSMAATTTSSAMGP